MPLNAQISLSIIAHESTSGDISRQMRVTPAIYAAMLTDGTGANQAQVVWSTTEAVSEAGDYTAVFSSLTDDRGLVTITAIKLMYVKNSGANSLQLFPTSWSNGPFAGSITLPPGSAVTFVCPTADGWATTSNNASLVIETPGQASTVEVVFIGEGTIT
jgi:hypothetical protein